MSKILDFLLELIREQFDKFYLLTLFFGGAAFLIWTPDNDKLVAWITSGAVIGAILMLVTGNKRPTLPPDKKE